jgi:hypothetical protein
MLAWRRSKAALVLSTAMLFITMMVSPMGAAATGGAGGGGGSWWPAWGGSSDEDRCATKGITLPTRPTGDHYSVLGVKQGASIKTIRAAYKKLAKLWHPDKNLCGPTTAASAFQLIAAAYGILSDEEQRDVFDRLGDDGLRRLQDGDPSVKKGWQSDSEILRRAGPAPPPLPLMDLVVTTIFAWLEKGIMMLM